MKQIQNKIMCLAPQFWVLVLMCGVGASLPVLASMVPGSQPKLWPANPAKHQVIMKRTAADETEKKMIALAESACPAKKDVEAAGKLPGGQSADQPWSNKEVNGLKIPYAITAAAIEYYTNFVQTAGAKEFKRYIEPSSKLTYQASVQTKQDFKLDGKSVPRVYVVKMKLEFDESFVNTTTEAVHFDCEREVVLDGDGKVLKITGDGDVEVPVMAI